MVLSPEEMKRLRGEGIDEETEFKGFLPYFTLADVNSDSPLYTLLHTVTMEKKNTNDVTGKREEAKPHYEETLKELNKKLRENQKRR